MNGFSRKSRSKLLKTQLKCSMVQGYTRWMLSSSCVCLLRAKPVDNQCSVSACGISNPNWYDKAASCAIDRKWKAERAMGMRYQSSLQWLDKRDELGIPSKPIRISYNRNLVTFSHDTMLFLTLKSRDIYFLTLIIWINNCYVALNTVDSMLLYPARNTPLACKKKLELRDSVCNYVFIWLKKQLHGRC